MLVTGKHKILMEDGTYKNVEDLKDGDRLMKIGPVKISPEGEVDEIQLYQIRGLYEGDGYFSRSKDEE